MSTTPAEAAGHDPAGAGRDIPLAPVAILFALLALLGALASLGVLPRSWCAFTAAPVLLFGVAVPVLARWSPVQPSAIKLLGLGLALAPLLSTAVYLAWRLALGPERALAATLACAAALQILSRGRTARAQPLGRAGAIALAVSAISAVVAALFLLRGNAARLEGAGLLHSALALAVERAVPPGNPWLAGVRWTEPWAFDAVVSLWMRALHVSPSVALAAIHVLCAFLAPLFAYFIAAPLSDDGASHALAAFVVAVGCAVWTGSGELAAAVSSVANRTAPAWLAHGPTALAVTLSAAAWASAAHALRHGRRPWVGLCGVFHGAALLVSFAVGAPAAVATALAALLFPAESRLRPRLLLALLAWSLPGLAVAASSHVTSFTVPIALAAWQRFDWPLLLLAPACFAMPFGRIAADDSGARGRRALAWLLTCGAVVGALTPLLRGAPEPLRGELGTALALTPLAALGAMRGLRSRGFGRVAALLWIAAASYGVASLAPRAWSWARDRASRDVELREVPLALLPGGPGPTSDDLRAACSELIARTDLGLARAVLIANPAEHALKQVRELPEHALAACTGLDLWCGARAPWLSREPRFQPRYEALLTLYRHKSDFDPSFLVELERLGRPAAIALVRDEDRAQNPAVLGKLQRLGFQRISEHGGVVLLLGPRSAAETFGASR